MEKKLYKEQLAILKYINTYSKKLSSNGIRTDLVPFSDFVTWANCLGKEKIDNLQKKRKLSLNYLKILVLELLSIGQNYKFNIVGPSLKKINKLNVIYSYCEKKDFQNNFYYDKYFGLRSNEIKNTYWFLISLDNYVPKTKYKNLFILYRETKKFKFYFLIKNILRILKKKKSFYYLNNTYHLSKTYASFFFNTFEFKNFNLFLPFENRPNQNAIIEKTKLISSSNLVNAYYHRLPEPLQTEMIYKKNKINNLYVSSKVQKKIFLKYFNWPKNKLKVIESLRYKNLKLRKNIIYLPYEIDNIDFYLSNLKYLSKYNLEISKNFSISIHPLKQKSFKHLEFKKLFKKLKFQKNSKKDNRISIILGEAGSVASECLETYGKVYHITNQSYNIFSSNIWNNLQTTKIKEGIYLYKKKSAFTMLNIGSKKSSFETLL